MAAKARAVFRSRLLRPLLFSSSASLAKKEDRTYTVAFAGTSVTAGHDNWFNESYPLVYERALGPVLAAGGASLHVRNHATGGNAISPSHFCAPTQLDGSPNSDVRRPICLSVCLMNDGLTDQRSD